MIQTALIVSILLVVSLARAEWELLLDTQTTSSVRVLETDGHRLFAGGSLEGLYTSDDNGDTWRTTHLSVGYAPAIAVSGDVIYAFVSEHGMFRSDDYGETWNPINNGLHTIHDHTLEIRIPYISQMLVARSDMVIAVGGFDGTYISRDRGETWRFPAEWSFPCPKAPDVPDFTFSDSIDSMIEYDGYLWAAAWSYVYRSPDDGGTWEILPTRSYGGIRDFWRVYDWTALGDKLYVAGKAGFGRWNEAELRWDHLSRGLPREPRMKQLAVNRGRIFAAFYGSDRGVWLFDQPSETWFPTGLQHVRVYSLVSHQSDLYAGTDNGIYRASISIVQPHGKAVSTWGAVKTD